MVYPPPGTNAPVDPLSKMNTLPLSDSPSMRSQLAAITLTRVILNTMHRMLYPFLAVFGRGLGVELSVMAFAITARSLVGVFSPLLAFLGDTRGRKAGMLLGLIAFTLGASLVLIQPTFPAFFLALVLGMVGKYIFDPTLQAYLGDRVPYARRGRVLGIVELGWSLSFICGVPAMGFLIARFGWRSPFPALGLAGLAAIISLTWLLPGDPPLPADRPGVWRNLQSLVAGKAAMTGLSLGLLISAANEVINLIFGVWMEDAYRLEIASLGATAAVIGAAELGGESLTVALTDRLGKLRAVGLGILLNSLAAISLPWLGRCLAGAMLALFLLYITFEFTLVSSIPIMTELLPAARATLMAANVSAISMGRAMGALLAPYLYNGGIVWNSLACLALNLLALLVLLRLKKRMAVTPKPQTSPSA